MATYLAAKYTECEKHHPALSIIKIITCKRQQRCHGADFTKHGSLGVRWETNIIINQSNQSGREQETNESHNSVTNWTPVKVWGISKTKTYIHEWPVQFLIALRIWNVTTILEMALHTRKVKALFQTSSWIIVKIWKERFLAFQFSISILIISSMSDERDHNLTNSMMVGEGK